MWSEIVLTSRWPVPSSHTVGHGRHHAWEELDLRFKIPVIRFIIVTNAIICSIVTIDIIFTIAIIFVIAFIPLSSSSLSLLWRYVYFIIHVKLCVWLFFYIFHAELNWPIILGTPFYVMRLSPCVCFRKSPKVQNFSFPPKYPRPPIYLPPPETLSLAAVKSFVCCGQDRAATLDHMQFYASSSA